MCYHKGVDCPYSEVWRVFYVAAPVFQHRGGFLYIAVFSVKDFAVPQIVEIAAREGKAGVGMHAGFGIAAFQVVAAATEVFELPGHGIQHGTKLRNIVQNIGKSGNGNQSHTRNRLESAEGYGRE